MMIFHTRHVGGELAAVHLGGGSFDAAAEWSRNLLERAASNFLTHDAANGVVRVMVEEGVATYRVTGEGPDSVLTRLESVEAGTCGVCKRESGKHQWWCSGAVY